MMATNLPTKFVSTPSNSLFCPLCNQLFKDPVISTYCGHTFCRHCIEGPLLVGNPAGCPIDHVVFQSNGVVPNHAVQDQLEDIKIYCQHGLHRVDSDDDFQFDENGCKEIIPLGRRQEHEDICQNAWVPCPYNSNHCGKFRKRDLSEHLAICKRQPCKNRDSGCNFQGTADENVQHMYDCQYSIGVEWEALSNLGGQNAVDGLQARYLIKAVKNLNERVINLEKEKQILVSQVQNCNCINLAVQMEKLSQMVDQLRIAQNALLRERSQSATDLVSNPALHYRRTVSTFGLNSYGSSRLRSSSEGPAHVLSFSEKKRMETWKMPMSFKCVGTFRGHHGIIRAVVSKGPYIFSGGSDHCLKVWDIKDKNMKDSRGCIATLQEHFGDIHALCTCGGFLYSAGTDKSIKMWNIEKLKLHASREDAHSDVIGVLVTTGKYLFSGSYSSIKIWRVGTMELLHTISDIHHWVRAIAIGPKKEKGMFQDVDVKVQKTVYSGSHNTVHIWDADEPFASKGNLQHSHGSIYSITTSQKYLILGTYNQNTHLYDINTHEHIKVLTGHLGIINDLTVSPSGNFLFTGSHDKTIQLWDLVKFLPVQVLYRHEGSVNCMTLRGDMLFSGSEDKEIKVFHYYQGLALMNEVVKV